MGQNSQQRGATSLETKYPRKFCEAVLQCVIRLQLQNMQLPPMSLFEPKDNSEFAMQSARITAEQQSRRSRLPPLIPDTCSVGVFLVKNPTEVP